VSLPVTVPYTFGTQTTSIPLAELDSNFTTVTSAINGIGNGSNPLSNATVTSTGSTTARSLATRFADVVNVLDWGASPSAGAATNTTAITNAINSVASTGGCVFFPAGSYNCNPIAINNASNVTLMGSDRQASTLLLTVTGVLMTFVNAQNCLLSQMTFQIAGAAQSIATSYGVTFNTGSSNNEVNSCWFVGFGLDALDFTGTALNPLTGNQVINCIFVGNGGNQLNYLYSNDFHILNNQFGSLVGVTAAGIGCCLTNSNAGLYQGNYHWSNTTGFAAVSCSYNTYSVNRFEINLNQGAYFNGGLQNQFINNKLYSNSQSGNGSYDNAYFINWGQGIVNANHVFTWDSTNSKWGIYFDSGCTDVQLKNNKVEPGSFDSGHGPYCVVSANGSNVYGDFETAACTTSTIAAGVSTYLGPVGQNFNQGGASFQIGKRCEILRLCIAVDTAPGAGQTFTYTVYVNGSPTAMTGSISGAGSFGTTIYNTTPAILVPLNSNISVLLVNSAGGAAAYHRYYLEYLEY
jgi:hypothetical protein